MAQAQQQPVNLIDDDASFLTILQAFALSIRSRQRFTEDFTNIRELMLASESQVNQVINLQNKTYRNHATVAQRCYINQPQTTCILALRRFAIIAIKEGGATFTTNDVNDFDLDWIRSITEEYTQKDQEPTAPGSLTVVVPKFKGTNWYEVRSQLELALKTVYGQSGVPLSYIIRQSRKTWEETENYATLQERRIDTKETAGADFDKDNQELYRILVQELDKSTLEDVIKGTPRSDGMEAWTRILSNVEGAHYRNELRRQANAIVTSAFWDPSRHFSFEAYFQKHTQFHDMMSKAGDAVSDWQKIEKFMEGIKCSVLQNVFINTDYNNMTFSQFYSDINEKYRRLVSSKQIRPASIFKRKISQMDSDHGRFRERRGRGGRFNRGGGRFRGRGRGRDGGRGNRYRNRDDQSINWELLPQGLDPNGSLNFDDNTWRGFSRDTKNEISKLRRLQQQQRMINSAMSSFNNGGDDNSTIATRSIFSINIPTANSQSQAPLPPTPSPQQPEQPSTRSNNAGNAFSS